MKKFTKLKKTDNSTNLKRKEDVLYSDDYIKLLSYEGWSMISEKDLIIIIPYLIESNEIIMRYEYIPTFKYVDGQEYHLTVLCGGIEKGEDPLTAAIRELEEEAGIVVKDDSKFEQMKPLFVSKGNCNKYHPFFLPLNEKDYYQVVAKGDGSKIEAKSKSIRINYKNVSSLNSSDLITEFMLLKIKDLI